MVRLAGLTSVWSRQGRKEILVEVRPFPFLNKPIAHSFHWTDSSLSPHSGEQPGGGVVVEVVAVQAVKAVAGAGAVDVPQEGGGVGHLPVRLTLLHTLTGLGLNN